MISSSRFFLAATFSIALAFAMQFSTPGLATPFDLAADWVDGSNPNRPWSYRVGTTVLPFDPSWTAGAGFPIPQPAYHPGDVPGNFLPAWYRANSVPTGFDNLIGDVIVHTNDRSNGNLALGVANVLFTAPTAGLYDISGRLWNANHFFPTQRPQDWRLLVNGVIRASGHLSGTVTRADAQTFDLPDISLALNDQVELDVFQAPGADAGFLVGTGLTITPLAPRALPEPSPLFLFGAGIVALAAVCRRRKDEDGKEAS